MSLSCKEIFEDKIAQRLTENPEVAEKIKASYQFELTGDEGGSWAVDLTEGSGKVVPGDIDDASVTITMASTDFVDLVEGRLNG